MHLSKEEVTRIIGQKIRDIRIRKKLTIEQAAHNAGLEYTQLSRIELGKINTSIYHVFKISETLEVKVHDVFKELYKAPKNNIQYNAANTKNKITKLPASKPKRKP
jgi:transcriptional regulator with XRE-family HTH domain